MTEPAGIHADDIRGPEGYENWKNSLEGIPPRAGDEIQLYSDSQVTNEITEGWGPYQALNTIGVAFQPACVPVVVLRTNYHDDERLPDLEKSNTSSYHGGGIAEEVSALIGLALGIRLRPGGKTRDIYFEPHQERPRAANPASVPTLLQDPTRPPMLPNMRKTANLQQGILAGYADLAPRSAVAVARAALLFQHGLWLSESSPPDAWLMFVSAVEVAAIYWRVAESKNDPEKLFRQLKPEWVKRLDRTGDSTIVHDMATYWTDLLGSTNRFLKFLLAHLPEPPIERPTVYQVDWSNKGMRGALDQIYNYRSLALHAGTPFPAPMCSAPFRISHENSTPAERPMGLAVSSSGGVWMRDEMPMHLHIFAYIVHGALMKWWDGLKSGNEQASPEE